MSTNQLTRCNRHPSEEARLKCGECGKSICTICMTLTGEGPRCQECIALMNNHWQPVAQVQGVVIEAGEEAARDDAARQAYYATEKTVYCARHPQTETLLRCGRCDTPICPRCMVNGGAGIRCPECAMNPQRTVGVRVEQQAAAARGNRAAPRDTGFRTYGRNLPAQKVDLQHYFLAIVVGFGTALALGTVWGFLLQADQFRRLTGRTGASGLADFMSQSIQGSIHLLPEILLGVLVGEAISRITRQRVGPGLQVVAGLSVALGILVSVLVVGGRIFQNATGQLPPFDQLLSESVKTIGQQFNGNGLGIVIFWLIGIAFAAYRLKR